jgi:hypothetical protein
MEPRPAPSRLEGVERKPAAIRDVRRATGATDLFAAHFSVDNAIAAAHRLFSLIDDCSRCYSAKCRKALELELRLQC